MATDCKYILQIKNPPLLTYHENTAEEIVMAPYLSSVLAASGFCMYCTVVVLVIVQPSAPASDFLFNLYAGFLQA